jgi:hypothetical protein
MLQLFRKKKTSKTISVATGVDVEILSLPKFQIPSLVNQYIAAMETEVSDEWCKCPWIIHPDDQEVKKGTCRICGERKDRKVHDVDPEGLRLGVHKFTGKRMRRGDEHPECPVHTREGMVLYFFEWVFTDAQRA